MKDDPPSLTACAIAITAAQVMADEESAFVDCVRNSYSGGTSLGGGAGYGGGAS